MTSKRQTTAKITILVLAIIAISVALTWSGRDTKLNYEIGRPWTNPTLTAPFEIPIELDEAAKQHIRDSIMANFIETYRIDSMVAKEQTRRLATVLATHKEVPSAIRSQLLATIDTIYRNGIVDNSTSDKITQNAGHRARILGANIQDPTATPTQTTTYTVTITSGNETVTAIRSLISSANMLMPWEMPSVTLPNIGTILRTSPSA